MGNSTYKCEFKTVYKVTENSFCKPIEELVKLLTYCKVNTWSKIIVDSDDYLMIAGNFTVRDLRKIAHADFVSGNCSNYNDKAATGLVYCNPKN